MSTNSLRSLFIAAIFGSVLFSAALDGSPVSAQGDSRLLESTAAPSPSPPTGTPAPTEAGATLIVNSVADVVDANPGDGVCATVAGACTLRAAIMEANALPGAEKIELPAGVFTLSLAGADEDQAATGDLDVLGSVEISGAGSRVTVIDGGGLDRVFQIHAEADATIESVSIQNGRVAGISGNGGGLENRGDLVLSDVVVVDNVAEQMGGGIYTRGTLTLVDFRIFGNVAKEGGGIANFDRDAVLSGEGLIEGNSALREGGGVYNYGRLDIQNTVITANETTLDPYQIYQGGGVYNEGWLTIEGGLISDNASPRGGGIASNHALSTLLDKTVLRGNVAALHGGAVLVDGSATLHGVIIEENRAGTGGGVYGLNSRYPTSPDRTLRIEGSTIRNNTAESAGGIGIFREDNLVLVDSQVEGNSADHAAGIWGQTGHLFLSNCSVSDNHTSGYDGGGIYLAFGELTVRNCRIRGNTAAYGGGIGATDSQVFVYDTVIEDNHASEEGGGLNNNFRGRATVVRSLIHGNSARLGGGIFNEFGYGEKEGEESVVTLLSSTVSENLASEQGGGIYNAEIVELHNSTLSGNSALAGPALFGIDTGQTSFVNSIVDSESGLNCAGDGHVESLGHNLESGDSCGLDAQGDLRGVDPRLGSLQDNGGPTLTHALLPGSPAIDAGDDERCEATDQRGQPRPADGDGDGAATCDIGAYEVQPTAPAQTFEDVPPDHWAFGYIERLYAEGHIAGCQVEPQRLYCPEDAMSRAEAAVFVEHGVWGADYIPDQPAPPSVFADVPVFEDPERNPWYAKWVTSLWKDGFTSGCGAEETSAKPRFCPEAFHTRAEAAVFFMRMLNGPGYIADLTPEEIQNLPFTFEDVSLPSENDEPWYSKWVYEALLEGLLTDCEDEADRGDALFRPGDEITRAEAACMMVKVTEKGAPSISQ